MKSLLLPLRRRCAGFVLTLAALGVAGTLTARAGVAPMVTDVTLLQLPGTKNVQITYDLTDPDSTNLTISIGVSPDGGVTWVPAKTFANGSDVGTNIFPESGKTVTWYAGVDMNNTYSSSCKVRVVANDTETEYFVLIPAGSYVMGNTNNDPDIDAAVLSVQVSDCYIEKTLVTGQQWDSVYQYALVNGYTFDHDHAGAFKATNHPVQSVSWYDAVKWCNARSQLAGRTPVYYTDAGLTTIYKSGQVANPYVNWSANGYRLPTEAEWEKAARGGLSGKRFPWGDTIAESQANYHSVASNAPYDNGPEGYNATYAIGGVPWTSPVGSFAANGYGLYDMAGNTDEWCWDWYGTPYGQPTAIDPKGPVSGTNRVLRGGHWGTDARLARCASRDSSHPNDVNYYFGFRCVKGL
jgi:formylglycine-generating enzyme required for sulfatase activity